MKILILSSNSPAYSAGLGADVMSSLIKAGHEVDFVCRYENFDDKSRYDVIYPKSKLKRLADRILGPKLSKRLRTLKLSMRRHEDKPAMPEGVIFHNGFEIHYIDESKPGVATEKILAKAPGHYDLVITLWWFDMLNSTSVRELSERYGGPVLVYAIDMAPMTGGCFYFRDCCNFRNGCQNCPAIPDNYPTDLAHKNFMLKQKNYAASNVAFLGNSWMNDFARQSGLFADNRIYNVSIIVDDNEFRPATNGNNTSKFRILARSSAEPRKGASYISQAIIRLWQSLDEAERNRIEVLTIGDSTIARALSETGIRCIDMGRVGRKQLIEAYQTATCFLSASVDDAGPSMVNQALMCGTPVVSFNNGTAVDVIKEGISGFKSSEIDADGFYGALQRAYSHLRDEKSLASMRKNARAVAMQNNSSEAFSNKIEQIYGEMTHEG